MLSRQSKVDTIADIIYDHIKGKHKDKLSIELAEKIVDALNFDQSEEEKWYGY